MITLRRIFFLCVVGADMAEGGGDRRRTTAHDQRARAAGGCGRALGQAQTMGEARRWEPDGDEASATASGGGEGRR